MNWVNALTDLDPALIWGLLSRGVGLVFVISFASLAPQVLPIAGSTGITPIRESLAAIERDFPSWKRFAYFPSLLWLNRSDAVLGALPWLGMAAGLAIVVGGPQTPWAFALCYAIYVSLDRAVGLVYPWDCVLFEAGFFGMLLPATLVLPHIAASSPPLPAVAWVYRLLVFRVMLGFGKHKFVGSTAQDSGYLKSFLVQQPLPTQLGWYAQKAPLPLLRLALFGTFVIEIIAPFTVFWPGPWCVAAAVLTIALMIGIELTGNFGYFNVVMVVLALSWLDSRTASMFSPYELFVADGRWPAHALVALQLSIAVLAFSYNTFCALTWTLWSPWTRVRPRVLTWPLTLARTLQPLRFVHAYGVFPPRTPPAAHFVPAIEASWDGLKWHTLTHRYSPTLETSPPRFCAPHHERFDQAVVYESLGVNEASIFRNITGRFDPYGYGGVPGALMLLHRIVRGTVPGDRFYDRSLERERGRPQLARARLYMLEPCSIAEHRQTGRWWRRTLVGPHFPPLGPDDGYFERALPVPELWHFDDLIWLKRSRVGALMERARRGQDAHTLAILEADELTSEHVDRFWNELLPAVTPGCREDWAGLRALVTDLRARFGHAELHRLERVAARYAVLLFAKIEPLFLDAGLKPVFGRGEATLNVKTNYHVRLLAYHVVSEGKSAYDAVMQDPQRAIEHAGRMTLFSGNYLPALFRYEAFVYQSQKLRVLQAYNEHEGRAAPSERQQRASAEIEAMLGRLWGAVDMAEFLRKRFTGPDDVLDVAESWPRFALLASGEVVRVEREG
ncbi:MAG: lipase maturation factor family protein [Polyangiales bacterium]